MRKLMILKLAALSTMVVMILGACSKKDNACQSVLPSVEKPAMVVFCTNNNIVYTEHSSGILYQIITAGTGAAPTVSSQVYVMYEGRLLNGTLIDSGDNSASTPWALNNLIEGWKIALPLLKVGGRIKMIIPSSLAYGCNGYASVPGNAPLYFDVTLKGIQ